MKTVKHVMSIINECVESENKNKILNRIGIKRKPKDSDFEREINEYLEIASEVIIPKSATTTPVAKSKKEDIKGKRTQK